MKVIINHSKTEAFYSVLTLLTALLIGVFVLNPIWAKLTPPFPILRVSPPITAPVDGPYYLINADIGYKWDADEPINLWYHPLLPFIVSFLPKWLPSNIWFWILSLMFSLGSLYLSYQTALLYSKDFEKTPYYLLFLPLIPGALGIATGNPEIPTLFFVSLLLLSVNKWHNWWITSLSALLAILTKPNALYMIPILIIYAIAGYKRNDRQLLIHSTIGASLIIIGWLGWMIYVDLRVNSFGAYWNARQAFTNFVAGDPSSFFLELARSFAFSSDWRDRLRYITALLIPIVNLWIISLTPLEKDEHRNALFAGNLAMLSLVLWQGNPNKVIVYTTTLPGYFAIYLLFTHKLFSKINIEKKFNRIVGHIFYWLYIALMLIFYIIGTPSGWYY